jgi:hypothetical protein
MWYSQVFASSLLIQDQILVLQKKKMAGGVQSPFGGEMKEKAHQKTVMVRVA